MHPCCCDLGCQSSILSRRECWGSFLPLTFLACVVKSRCRTLCFNVDFGPRIRTARQSVDVNARSTSLVWERVLSRDWQNFPINLLTYLLTRFLRTNYKSNSNSKFYYLVLLLQCQTTIYLPTTWLIRYPTASSRVNASSSSYKLWTVIRVGAY